MPGCTREYPWLSVGIAIAAVDHPPRVAGRNRTCIRDPARSDCEAPFWLRLLGAVARFQARQLVAGVPLS
jgi:hypothetical protein